MTLRYLLFGAASAAVTLAVLLVMRALVEPEQAPLEDSVHGGRIEFVRLKKDSETRARDRQLPDRAQPPPAPPPPPAAPRPRELPQQDLLKSGSNFTPTVDMSGGPWLGAPSDTDVVPLVRVNPQYPLAAQERGLEGWVEIEFTITAVGTVRGPRVTATSGGTVFNRAAIRAIRRWKYRPRLVDGQPVERQGVRVRLNFSLEGTR
ncbi:MAG: energy transducer TonB [Proteobacteria bacterium]|nr:energy transducer TonB [Pseudomonadota bacterium]